MVNTNQINIIGTVVKVENTFINKHGKNFAKLFVSSKRLSGVEDIIPVVSPLSDEIAKTDLSVLIGKRVNIEGMIRTRNIKGEDDKQHLEIFVAGDFETLSTSGDSVTTDDMMLNLEGTVCIAPEFRKTPKGRKITNFTLASNYTFHRSYYLPVVAFGKHSTITKDLLVGDKVKLNGRIQSRKYIKDGAEKTAYEIVVFEVNKINDFTGLNE